MNFATDPLTPNPLASKRYALSQPNYFDQIRVLTTHPFFTGKCPQCSQKLALVHCTPAQCSCSACGWSDHDENPAPN